LLQDEPTSPEDALSLKEIKVRIPVSFHLKLHAFKVLKGKPISDTIVEALDAYFKAAEERKAHREGAAVLAPPAGDLAPAAADAPTPPRAPPLGGDHGELLR
jgi:hypothetical protein